MSSGLLHVFVELGNRLGTSNYVLYGRSCGNNDKDKDSSPKIIIDEVIMKIDAERFG